MRKARIPYGHIHIPAFEEDATARAVLAVGYAQPPMGPENHFEVDFSFDFLYSGTAKWTELIHQVRMVAKLRLGEDAEFYIKSITLTNKPRRTDE